MAITVTITNAGLNLMRDALDGVAGTLPAITYVAVGTGSQGTPATATQLAAEAFRKALTSFSNGASNGESRLNLYLSPQDTNGTVITEVGWFAGNASATVNSGTMVAYGVYSPSHTKASTESIQLQLDNTF